jgi:hypothetical protein
VLEVAVWLAALTFATVIATASANIAGRSAPATAYESGRRFGEVLGVVLVALLLAFVAWWVVVRVSRRRGTSGRRLSSPIVPLIACILVIPLGGVGGAAAGPAPTAIASRTLDDVLRIATPYHLERSPADEEQQLTALLAGGGTGSFRSVEVRRIYNGTGLAGFALVADAGVVPGSETAVLGEVERGLGTDEVTKAHVAIGGHDALSGVAGGAGYAVWIEAPFVKVVFAPTEQEATDISTAFVTG